MIIYFADRNLKITGLASTALPGGFRLYEDLTTEEIESGVNVFTCKISYNDSTRLQLESAVTVGNFILKGSGDAFSEKENTYDSLYQIIETEFDTLSQELFIYAEDAGLELINRVVGEVTYKDKTLKQMLESVLPSDWSLKITAAPATKKTYSFDGENTATERINSIVNIFSYEAFYSFVIERFQITEKVINVVPKRGNQKASVQLRLNLDINRIVTKTSIAELATAITVTGGTPEGSDKPVTLKGYSYSYIDPETKDTYSVDTNTGQMRNTSAMKRWSSILDNDGLILKRFSFDTTNKATLAGQARAALQKLSLVAVEYEVDFIRLPEGTRVGDRINIIDEQGELFLEARILKIETSVSDGTQKATIGDYIRKTSGISESVAALAREFSDKIRNGLSAAVLSIVSSGGNIFHNVPVATILTASVFYGTSIVQTDEELKAVFGDGAAINWYSQSGDKIGSGFTLPVSSNQNTVKITARLEL